MIDIIKSSERYHFETDWLSTYWHFSFDHYYDPQNVSFGPLRVFNDDTIRPAGGFPLHSHREMEILTYVIEGQLEHQDSLGNRGVIGPGELQRMSAGTGIRHSEYNASKTGPVHLLQFWIEPAAHGLKPSWEQRRFSREERRGRLMLVASGKQQNGALHIHQDASVYAASLEKGETVAHTFAPGRQAYLFVISGGVTLNGQPAAAGDQARLTDEQKLSLTTDNSAELLLVDLP